MAWAGDDASLLAALRAGDEAAFRSLVMRHHRAMLSVALQYVPTRSVAEEVVQETWLAVIKGLDGFEERSSLKTWIFRILANRARTRGAREARSVPLSSLVPADASDEEAAVAAERFQDRAWSVPPTRFSNLPEERLTGSETRAVVTETISSLPANQRDVITLRDVHGWTSGEVCALLELSEVNQRVLLHRARAKVRAALEAHLAAVGS